MHGHRRSIELPIYGSKVLGLRDGTLEMHGCSVGPTWTKLGTIIFVLCPVKKVLISDLRTF